MAVVAGPRTTGDIIMTTATALLCSDMLENSRRHRKYWKSSSLPVTERFNNRPITKHSPRNRVLKRILQRDMAAMTNRLSSKKVANNASHNPPITT